ncbi:DnaJ domain-containing protein [Marine Group I thaumarchaeote]|uniref:DnaJ domain-containing protein n=1 Tax=Marine Group I thaumarchaeote TaxID=2511932 RepID=A0A7K4MLR6_9ARCH|nr:DnaJ domain-containing protein [Marine Group I thaumarchaeote]
MMVKANKYHKLNDIIRKLEQSVNNLESVLNKFNFEHNLDFATVYEHCDPHKLLEIDADSTNQQVKKAFRKMVLKHHPDKNPERGKGDELKKIIQSYREIRKKQSGESWNRGEA